MLTQPLYLADQPRRTQEGRYTQAVRRPLLPRVVLTLFAGAVLLLLVGALVLTYSVLPSAAPVTWRFR